MKRLIHQLKGTITLSRQIEAMIAGRDQFHDLSCYDLHRQLSNQQPDSALLCMALGALDIVESVSALSFDFPSFSLLQMEAETLINDYGSVWLRNALDADVDPDSALDLLTHIPEDLETLAELLKLCKTTIEASHPTQAALLDMFAKQAPAHSLIAQEYIDVLSSDLAPVTPSEITSNVIAFPGTDLAQLHA